MLLETTRQKHVKASPAAGFQYQISRQPQMPDWDEATIIRRVMKFAQSIPHEREHAYLVAKVALRLFDGLADMHYMQRSKRMLLYAAALLHDIGKAFGHKGHHKASQHMILNAQNLPFSDRQRCIIALTARYHRKSLPKPSHTLYNNLDHAGRKTVNKLAALLRVADGLDELTLSLLEDFDCHMTSNSVTLDPKFDCESTACLPLCYKLEKTDLFERVFQRHISLADMAAVAMA